MLRRNAIVEAAEHDDNDNTCSVPAAEFEQLNMSSSSSLKSSSIFSNSTQESASSPNSSQQTLLDQSENGGGSEHGSSHHHGHHRSSSGGKHERKKSSHRHHHRQSSHDPKNGGLGKDRETEHLSRWMASGNIVYKSVGLGLMDLAVGMRLIELAKEKGVGTYIEGF